MHSVHVANNGDLNKNNNTFSNIQHNQGHLYIDNRTTATWRVQKSVYAQILVIIQRHKHEKTLYKQYNMKGK